MASKTEVSIDFDNAAITWGVDDGQPALTTAVNIREVKITLRLLGKAREQKSRIIGVLRRSLKPFVRNGRINRAVDFNTRIKLFLVHYLPGQIDEWQHDHPWAQVGNYQYGVWFNLEATSEMLIRDVHNVTSLVSDDLELDAIDKPTGIEFVKSEGGVLFIPHRLGLDCQTHQAVIAQRVRRDLWRRTRGGSNFSDYGNLSLRNSDEHPNIIEVWLGENHVWSVDYAVTFDIIPEMEYFTTWGIDYVLETRTARKRLADFTFNQLAHH